MGSNPFDDQPEAGPSGTSAGGAAVPASQGTATFLRRLAGQSVNKAGLAKDQSEVNRIIWEASKGSKYYEREKAKDDELGLKIARLLKRVRVLEAVREGLAVVVSAGPGGTDSCSIVCRRGMSCSPSLISLLWRMSAMSWCVCPLLVT